MFEKTVSIFILSLLIVTMLVVALKVQPANADNVDWWPMFHHDLNHTGYSTSAAPNTNQTAWSYTTGDIIFSSPAVAGGMVYVGSYDHKVYCLDAVTGALVWSYTTGWIVCSSPAVSGGMVYVGSIDGKAYCLNAATGAFVWSYTTGGAVYSSPAVVGGLVYVGSWDDNVYCLNAATGAFVWSYTTGGFVLSCPAVVGGLVYVGSHDGKVYCLNAATGALVWSYTIVAGWSSLTVSGGMVYVGSDKVYCLDAATGALVWSTTTGSGVWSSPAVAGGLVYVGSQNVYVWEHDAKFYCLDAVTGAIVWNYTTGENVASSPAVAGGMVYVGSYDCKVYAFGPTMLQLTVASAYGSPSPTSGVFPYGTSITASVTSPVTGPAGTQYVCTGWTGTGDVPVSGIGTTLTFTITQNSSITWNWKTQYLVTFNQTGVGSDFNGTVVTIEGTNYDKSGASIWYDDDSTSNFAFQSPLIVPLGAKQYDWTSTSGLSTLQSGSITVTGPGNVTADYATLVHDVAVTNLTVHTIYNRTYVYQGTPANFTVTVWDNGDFPENVMVTLYYNITANDVVGTQNISLLAGQNGTLLFVWNTTGVTPCYTRALKVKTPLPR